MLKVEEDNNYWVFSVDIAEGTGGDYSVINIFQLKMLDKADWKGVTTPGSFVDFFGIHQVGRFRSNSHTIEEFAKTLYILGFDLFYSENVKLAMHYAYFLNARKYVIHLIQIKIDPFDRHRRILNIE